MSVIVPVLNINRDLHEHDYGRRKRSSSVAGDCEELEELVTGALMHLLLGLQEDVNICWNAYMSIPRVGHNLRTYSRDLEPLAGRYAAGGEATRTLPCSGPSSYTTAVTPDRSRPVPL